MSVIVVVRQRLRTFEEHRLMGDGSLTMLHNSINSRTSYSGLRHHLRFGLLPCFFNVYRGFESIVVVLESELIRT